MNIQIHTYIHNHIQMYMYTHIVCCFIYQQHIRSYQDRYQLGTVCTHGDCIVLPRCGSRIGIYICIIIFTCDSVVIHIYNIYIHIYAPPYPLSSCIQTYNMYTYVYIIIYVYIHAHIYLYAYIYQLIYGYTYKYTYTHKQIYTYKYTYSHRHITGCGGRIGRARVWCAGDHGIKPWSSQTNDLSN